MITYREWNRVAKSRNPEKWCGMIGNIKDEVVRIQVACIVWWDFFGSRRSDERWPHLDGYINRWKKSADRNLVRAELIVLGYPEALANQRILEGS